MHLVDTKFLHQVRVVLLEWRRTHDHDDENSNYFSEWRFRIPQENYDKLCFKMRNHHHYIPKAFSMKFQAVHGDENHNELLLEKEESPAFDVKICYTFQWILISKFDEHVIQVFDADKKILKYQLYTLEKPRMMCVEENCKGVIHKNLNSNQSEGGEEKTFLIFGRDDETVFKINLKSILERMQRGLNSSSMTTDDIIWKQLIDTPNGICVKECEETSENFVYVVDGYRARVVVLRSMNGSLVQYIDAEHGLSFSSPWSISVIQPTGDLMITEGLPFPHIRIIRPERRRTTSSFDNKTPLQPTRWECVKILGEQHLRWPLGAVCENQTSKNIYVCDKMMPGIFVLDLEGHLITRGPPSSLKRHGKINSHSHPCVTQCYAVCLNEWTGELLIATDSSHSLCVYR
nr:unnamed protein product [Naegleria fowleri]